jgi:hypothetical protein
MSVGGCLAAGFLPHAGSRGLHTPLQGAIPGVSASKYVLIGNSGGGSKLRGVSCGNWWTEPYRRYE